MTDPDYTAEWEAANDAAANALAILRDVIQDLDETQRRLDRMGHQELLHVISGLVFIVGNFLHMIGRENDWDLDQTLTEVSKGLFSEKEH